MEAWIDLARGPLFRISLAICVLGLGYRFVTTLSGIVAAWWRAGDRDVPLRAVTTATLSWLFPAGLLRSRPLYSAASVLFHVGIIGLPLLLAGHVVLLEPWLPAGLLAVWPTLAPGLADGLSILTIAMLVGLLASRVATPMTRSLSRGQDILILVVLLLVVGFGFLAANPGLSPADARLMLLYHILLADLALVLTPVSKIAHCVLFPLTQLVFQIGWHFPEASGRHVAIVLAKENEPV